MSLNLPNSFKLRMAKTLPEHHYKQLMDSYDKPAYRAFRFFDSKIDPAFGRSLLPFETIESALNPKSLLFDEKIKIGRHPFYHGGALYPQEPSAALVVDVADIQPNQTVIDVCSAPGGKSLQLLHLLKGKGYCVSNEIDRKRVKILMSNLERMGDDNSIVTSMSAQQLSQLWPHYFDRVIADAPCSGEGTYRKDISAQQYDKDENVLVCSLRQKDILHHASKLVKQGGYLIYSTCTFNQTENEDVVEEFLSTHADFTIEPVHLSVGQPGFGKYSENVRRIYPFDGGEGQFVAKLKYLGVEANSFTYLRQKPLNHKQKQMLAEVFTQVDHRFYQLSDRIYFSSQPTLAVTSALKKDILVGWDKGNYLLMEHECSKNRHLKHLFKNKIELNLDQANQYLQGEVLNIQYVFGWGIVLYHSVSLGLIKGDGSVCKNKYPKGLRNLGVES